MAPEPEGELESAWVEAGEHRLHVWTSTGGDVGRPPVVLVHGIVSSRYLLPTASRLARSHAVVAMDLPGFGRSDPVARAVGISALADVVADTISALCVGRPVLVGHSIGAQIVLDLARRRPQALSGLVLVGPTGDPATTTVGRLWARWLATAPREPLAFNALVLRELAEVGPRRMLSTARSAVADPFEAKLQSVGVPCLVVRGEHDRVAPLEWADHVRTRLGGPPLEVIPGVAHTVVFSAPEQLASLIAGLTEHVTSERPEAD
jgi:pimeloyl-ACP methyl ester carboxylesterase